MKQFIVIIDWENRKASHIKFDDAVSVQQFLETVLELGTILMQPDDSWAVVSKGPSNDLKAVKFVDKKVCGHRVNSESSLMTYQRLN